MPYFEFVKRDPETTIQVKVIYLIGHPRKGTLGMERGVWDREENVANKGCYQDSYLSDTRAQYL